MPADVQLLSSIQLFESFSDDDLHEMAGLVQVREYANGQLVCRQGETDGGFYMVIEGMLSVFRKLPDMQEIFLARLHRGDLVGYLTLIDGKPRTANVRAVGDCRLAELPPMDFKILFSSNSSLGLRFQQAIARDMVQSIRLVNQRFTRAATISPREFRSPAHLDGLYDDSFHEKE